MPAITTISAITPTLTPAMDNMVISEIKARFWRVLRYRPDCGLGVGAPGSKAAISSADITMKAVESASAVAAVSALSGLVVRRRLDRLDLVAGGSGALEEVGLPQAAIPLALLLFNLGVEAGQLLNDEQYLEAVEENGDEFDARMGAEAVFELLKNIDLHVEAVDAAATDAGVVPTTTEAPDEPQIVTVDVRMPEHSVDATVSVDAEVDGDFDLAAELLGALNGEESGRFAGGAGGTTEEEGFEQVFDMPAANEATWRMSQSSLVKASIYAPRTSFEISGDGDTLYLTAADAGRVRQVVLNLLTNAVKFTREGGRVAVRWEKVEGGCRIEVADSGIGIPRARPVQHIGV